MAVLNYVSLVIMTSKKCEVFINDMFNVLCSVYKNLFIAIE